MFVIQKEDMQFWTGRFWTASVSSAKVYKCWDQALTEATHLSVVGIDGIAVYKNYGQKGEKLMRSRFGLLDSCRYCQNPAEEEGAVCESCMSR